MVTRTQLNRWRKDPACFIEEAVRVPGRDGRPKPAQLWPIQREFLSRLKPDRYGRLPYRTLWLCWPRRSGKSSLSRWLAAWSFLLFPDRECWFVSTSKEQTYNVLFNDLRKDILRSPILLEICGGEENVRAKEILAAPLGSRAALLPYDPDKAHGLKVDAAVLSEVWAFETTEIYQALLIGTATCDGVCILDSTAPPEGSPWEQLLREPPEDMLVDWQTGLETYDKTPIKKQILTSFKRTLSPVKFRAKILNEVVEAGPDRVFTREQIEAVQRDYPVPASKLILEGIFLQELGAPEYAVRIGLDRSLGRHNLTVVSCIAYSVRGSNRLAVLASQDVVDGRDQAAILNAIMAAVDYYGRPAGIHVEAYQGLDIEQTLRRQGLPVVLESASGKAQNEAWPIFYNAVVNREFVFSSELTDFAEELGCLGHDPAKGKWGSVTKRRSSGPGDDRLFSVLWPLSAALKRSGLGGGHIEVGYSDSFARKSAEQLLGHGLERAEVCGISLDW